MKRWTWHDALGLGLSWTACFATMAAVQLFFHWNFLVAVLSGIAAGSATIWVLTPWAIRRQGLRLGIAFIAGPSATVDPAALGWKQPKRHRHDRLVEATIWRPESGEEKIVVVVHVREGFIEGYDRPIIITPGSGMVGSLGFGDELPPLITAEEAAALRGWRRFLPRHF